MANFGRLLSSKRTWACGCVQIVALALFSMLRAAIVLILSTRAAVATVSTIAYLNGTLMVTIQGAEVGSKLQLMRLRPEATGCADSVGATLVLEEQPITDNYQSMTFPAEKLQAGMYCAMVLSPSANYTTLWPQELRSEHDLSGLRASETPVPCKSWKATVTLKVSYARSSAKASVNVLENKTPLCEHLRVSLWKTTRLSQFPRCATHVNYTSEQTKNLSVVALFENLTAGNYCVRVTPVCSQSEDCLTLTSKIVEMPSGKVSYSAERDGVRYLLWLLLLLSPLVLGALVAAVLATFWAQRQCKAQQRKPCKLEMPLLANNFSKDAGVLVVKVVYSRDSEPHVKAVSQLCELIRRELGVRVEWDEAAVADVHITHDWAMSMAQLPCPHFNSAAMTTAIAPVKMLVLESDGALLKHQAYQQHKDLGEVSESAIDELYHTTYAALLSNRAQALGDYCHIAVARLPYTTLPHRLHLVPGKRYVLPQHLRQLLATLLRGTALPDIDAALCSEAHGRFCKALSNAGDAHKENGFTANSVCGKIQVILDQSETMQF
ncbi:uncharacterized protein [Dermacentor andersoni]|uniref:uncharacterized protein isoform X3 n=1 Tax=Dermacentor andersoni TaxID=34620 RepID=UPI003B3BBD29